MKHITKISLLTLFFATTISHAYGYLDPGTGSFIIQLLIAALASAVYAIKYFWSNIKAFFSKFKKRRSPRKKKPTPPSRTKSSAPMSAKKK